MTCKLKVMVKDEYLFRESHTDANSCYMDNSYSKKR